MTTLDNEIQIQGPRRRRRAAAAYLREKHGVPCTENFLAKLAVAGEGPAFRYYGRYPIYEDPDLDAYVASRLSAKVHSTSGLPPRDGVHRGRRPRKGAAELQPA
jgi:hypothetical protein